MALDLYAQPDPSTKFTTAGDLTNPFAVALDGLNGETVDTKIYLRNDASTKYYTGITISLTDTVDNITDGTNSYYWKLYAGNTKPTEAQWSSVSYANTISMSNIGSAISGATTTYLPLWVRISVPRGAPIRSYINVSFKIDYTEYSPT